MMVIQSWKDVPMRISLIAAAALSLVAQVASARQAVQAQSEQTNVQTSHRPAWVDHTRAAQPGDYNA